MQTFQKVLLQVLWFLKKLSIFAFVFLKKTSLFLYRCIRRTSIILWKTLTKTFFFLRALSIRSWKILKSIFNITMNIIGYIFLWASILLLFFIPVLYSGFALGNTDYSYIVPYKVFVALLFVLLMLVSLGTYFIMRKRFLLHFVWAFSALSLAFSFGFLGFTEMYNNHIHEGVYTQDYILESFTGTTLNINEFGIDVYGNTYYTPENNAGFMMQFEKSESEYYEIEVENHIFSDSSASVEYIGNQLSDLEVSELGGTLELSLPNNQIFKEKTNYALLYKVIKIYIPEGRQLRSNLMGYYGKAPYCDGVFISTAEFDVPHCKTAQKNIVEMILEETQGIE